MPLVHFRTHPVLGIAAGALFAALGCARASASVGGGVPMLDTSSDLVETSQRPADPRGIYHNRFSGGFSGTEWLQVTPLGRPNGYIVADIFGGGLLATIAENGTIELGGGVVGSGEFSSADAFILEPTLQGSRFTFDNVRAPDTTADFPLELDSVIPGAAILAGTYESETVPLDARTGEPLGGSRETLTVAVDGTTLRITDPRGSYFQGVFASPSKIAFRVVVPTPHDERFRSFPGSEIDVAQNMVGAVTIVDVNTWTAIFLLQSRTPLGSQTQRAVRFRAARKTPLPAGDLDGDGRIDGADRAVLLEQRGRREKDAAFLVAADLIRDGVIDQGDVDAFDTLGPSHAR